MKKYKSVIFDLDGTIIDPQIGGYNSIRYALDKFGHKDYDEQQFVRFIGPPLHLSFMDIYGFSKEDSETLCKYFREYYDISGKNEITVYEEMPAVIETLYNAGLELIIATTKAEIYAKHIVEKQGLDKYFKSVVGSNLDNSLSNKSELVSKALTLIENKAKEKIIMVGDKKFDIIGAKDNSIDSIGVKWGYAFEDEFEIYPPTFTARQPKDLLSIIL